MRIFENNGRTNSAPRCSYCRSEGHTANKCPQAPKDWEHWSKKHVPPNSDGQRTHWWSEDNPKYWGEWYLKCQSTMEKIARYQERQASPKAKRTTATRTCGFCGGVGHTRRNCSVMENFLADCYKANENWRRRAYEVLVQDHGIYVGGAIKVKKTTSYHQALPDTAVALITDVNFDKLNLLCANSQYGDYRQGLTIQANINGQSTHIQVHPRHWNNPVTEHVELCQKFELLFKSVDGYGHYRWDGAITSSATPLDPSWVTDYRDAYDWLVKKRSLERLKEEGVYDLVQRFK